MDDPALPAPSGGHSAAGASRRTWGFRLAAAAVSTLLSLGGLFLFLQHRAQNEPIYLQEPGHERTGHRYLYDPDLGWRNIPNWQATTNGRKLTINSRGLRDREYSYEKPPGVRRILVLGDSFVWGYGVGDDEIFTEVLERRLERSPPHAGVRYEVLNTGVSGWGTDQEYLFLRREGFRYRPDVVVLAFFIVNDAWNNSTSRYYGMNKPVFLNASLELANVPVPRPSAEAPVIRSRISPVDVTVAIIRQMRDDCLRHHCRLVVVKFGRFLPRWKKDPVLLAAERALNEQVCGRLGIPYQDLDDVFASRNVTVEEILRGNDDGHWNAHGHRLVGDFLYEFLLESKLLDAP